MEGTEGRKIKILVTGGGGFIGSHLVEELIDAGHEVSALVRYGSTGSIGWLEPHRENRRLQTVLGDIGNAEQVAELVKNHDVIFNLASLIGIPYSYVAPRSYFDVNLIGLINILDAMKGLDDKLLIQMSTSEVYGSPETLPISENHKLQAQSPYSASKIAAEMAAMSYHRSFGISVVVPRVFNNFGPRQSVRAVIPTIISQALSGVKEIRLGNISTERDFLFVKDTCKILNRVMQQSEPFTGKVVNVGTGRSYSIEDVAKKIFSLLGVECSIVQEDERKRPVSSEVDHLCCDNRFLTSVIGDVEWKRLEIGLEETISWTLAQGQKHGFMDRRYAI